MKKSWKKPKLVVLVRGRMEENVLATCKSQVKMYTGPGMQRPKCEDYLGLNACHTLGNS